MPPRPSSPRISYPGTAGTGRTAGKGGVQKSVLHAEGLIAPGGTVSGGSPHTGQAPSEGVKAVSATDNSQQWPCGQDSVVGMRRGSNEDGTTACFDYARTCPWIKQARRPGAVVDSP